MAASKQVLEEASDRPENIATWRRWRWWRSLRPSRCLRCRSRT